MKTRTCEIHVNEPMFESNPADVENGPTAADVENAWVCLECQWEMEEAYWQSVCVAHRTAMSACVACYFDEIDSDREEAK